MKNQIKTVVRRSGSLIAASSISLCHSALPSWSQPSPEISNGNSTEAPLPIISNNPTSTLNNFIGNPDWLDLNFSILSQNNGTPDANDRQIFTSSNLATLDLKIWLNHWMDDHNKNGFNIHAIGTQRAGEILEPSFRDREEDPREGIRYLPERKYPYHHSLRHQ